MLKMVDYHEYLLYQYKSITINKGNTCFFWVYFFIIPVIFLNKFAFKNDILLVLLKKDKNFYYICYTIGKR